METRAASNGLRRSLTTTTSATAPVSRAHVVTVPLTLSNLAAFKRQIGAHAPATALVDTASHNAQDENSANSLMLSTSSPFRVPTPTASTTQFRARLAEDEGEGHVRSPWETSRGASPNRADAQRDAVDAARFFASVTVPNAFGEVSKEAPRTTHTPPPPPLQPQSPTRMSSSSDSNRHVDNSAAPQMVTVSASLLDRDSTPSRSVAWSEARQCSPVSTRACTPLPPPPPVPAHDATTTPPRQPSADVHERDDVGLSPAPRVPPNHAVDDEARAAPSPAGVGVEARFARGASPLLAMYYLPSRTSLSTTTSPRKTRHQPWTGGSGGLTSDALVHHDRDAVPSLSPSRWAAARAATPPPRQVVAAPQVATDVPVGVQEATTPPPSSSSLHMSTLSGHTWDVAVDLHTCSPGELVVRVAETLRFPAAQVQLKHVDSGWVATTHSSSSAALATAAPFVKARDVFLVILSTNIPGAERSPRRASETPRQRLSSHSLSPRPRKQRRTDASDAPQPRVDHHTPRQPQQQQDARPAAVTKTVAATSTATATTTPITSRDNNNNAGTRPTPSAVSHKRLSLSPPPPLTTRAEFVQGRGVPPPRSQTSPATRTRRPDK